MKDQIIQEQNMKLNNGFNSFPMNPQQPQQMNQQQMNGIPSNNMPIPNGFNNMPLTNNMQMNPMGQNMQNQFGNFGRMG